MTLKRFALLFYSGFGVFTGMTSAGCVLFWIGRFGGNDKCGAFYHFGVHDRSIGSVLQSVSHPAAMIARSDRFIMQSSLRSPGR